MPRTTLPPLEQVDPAKAWQPWGPTADDPWNLKWAGHLYRRATFGPVPPRPERGPYDHLARLREAVKEGLQPTLDKVLRTEPDDDYKGFRKFFIDDAGAKAAGAVRRPGQFEDNRNYGPELRGWWLYVMWYSPQQLRERMTLFWHNHFATSIVKVQRPPLMYYQNRLLREHALGKFEPFLQEISKDPAMLVWLDSNANVKGTPNENFARELMELFSLGVNQGYTEKDIREAARAFTGWHTTGSFDRYEFNAGQHDDGEKTVFDQKGNWNGDDVVRLCLRRERKEGDGTCAAYFLCKKLYREFIGEMKDPPPALLKPLAESLRKSDYDVADLVKTMLRSRHFFSDHAYRQKIKNPVEFVMHAARDAGPVRVEPRSLASRTEVMGMQLFAPPNVKGWEGGKSWLNTATVLARHNFAQLMTTGSGQINLSDDPEAAAVGVAVDPSALLRIHKITDPKAIADHVVDTLLQGDLDDKARARLYDFLAEGKPQGDALWQRAREAFHAVMTMPEYQLA